MTVVRLPKHGHRLPEGRRRSCAIMFFLSQPEKDQLDAEAGKAGMPRGTYMRARLLYGLKVPRGMKTGIQEG